MWKKPTKFLICRFQNTGMTDPQVCNSVAFWHWTLGIFINISLLLARVFRKQSLRFMCWKSYFQALVLSGIFDMYIAQGFLWWLLQQQVLLCSLFHLSQKFFDLHVFLTTHITYNGIDMKYLMCFPFRKFQLFWYSCISSLGFLHQKYLIVINFITDWWSSGNYLTILFYGFLSFIFSPHLLSYFSTFVCRQNFKINYTISNAG